MDVVGKGPVTTWAAVRARVSCSSPQAMKARVIQPLHRPGRTSVWRQRFQCSPPGIDSAMWTQGLGLRQARPRLLLMGQPVGVRAMGCGPQRWRWRQGLLFRQPALPIPPRPHAPPAAARAIRRAAAVAAAPGTQRSPFAKPGAGSAGTPPPGPPRCGTVGELPGSTASLEARERMPVLDIWRLRSSSSRTSRSAVWLRFFA